MHKTTLMIMMVMMTIGHRDPNTIITVGKLLEFAGFVGGRVTVVADGRSPNEQKNIIIAKIKIQKYTFE